MKAVISRKTANSLFRKITLLAFLTILSLSLPPHVVLADDPVPDFPPPGPLFPPGDSAGVPILRIELDEDDFPIYLPLILRGRSDFLVDPQNRTESLNFYLTYYANQASVPVGWTGNHSTCAPGTTSPEFRAAVLQRINYFRAMAGVPPVSLTNDSNRLAQAAALIMSVNRNLSHDPPTTWQCYSTDGHDGAGSSNLALGVSGWNAVTAYINDLGAGNTPLGHRRWLLYPQTQEMGTGDVPATAGYPTTNALRVFDAHMWETRPATRDNFVSWPPPGYVPRPVVFQRWSFSYPGADFSSASVTMTSSGGAITLTQFPVVNGYGENTLAWAPAGFSQAGAGLQTDAEVQTAADIPYQISIQNVVIGGQTRSFNYTVTVFDP